MIRLFRLYLLALALATFFSGPVVNANTLEKIKSSGELVVGIASDLEPFGFRVEEEGFPVGYDIDYAKELAKLLSVDLRLKVVNTGDRLTKLLDGDIDLLISGLNKNDLREMVIDTTDHYLITGQKVLTRDPSINILDDLGGKLVGTIVGTISETCARDRCVLSTIVSFDNYIQAIRALQSGEIDVFTSDEAILSDIAGALPQGEYLIPDFFIMPEEYQIGLRKGETEFRKAVNNAIGELVKSGVASELRNRWFTTLTEEKLPPAYGAVVRKAGTRSRFLGIGLSGALETGSEVMVTSLEGRELCCGVISSVIGDEFYMDVDDKAYENIQPGFLVSMNMSRQMVLDVLLKRKPVLERVKSDSAKAAEEVRQDIEREALEHEQRSREFKSLSDKQRVLERSRYYEFRRLRGRYGDRIIY